MEYVIGEQTGTMHSEDCLYFDARIPHGPKLEETWTALSGGAHGYLIWKS
jgi:hypothetical protein